MAPLRAAGAKCSWDPDWLSSFVLLSELGSHLDHNKPHTARGPLPCAERKQPEAAEAELAVAGMWSTAAAPSLLLLLPPEPPQPFSVPWQAAVGQRMGLLS